MDDNASVGEPGLPATVPPPHIAVANQIRAWVISGHLSRGEQLASDSILALRLRATREAVHDAIQLLIAEQVLEPSRGSVPGVAVAPLGGTDMSDVLTGSLALLLETNDLALDDLMHVRVLMETAAAGLAAERRTRGQLDNIAAHLKARSHDLDVLFQMNRGFHELVMMATGNRLLPMVVLPVLQVSGNRVRRRALDPEVWARVQAEHVLIYEAIRDQDAEAARDVTARHLGGLRSCYAAVATTPLSS
jgi:GntR family transcriptional repressor for pyruvate dehydrogenase complex